MTAPGFGAKPHVTQLPSGQWQVVLEPTDPVAKELMPDQPIVGYGATEQEARFDGLQAFARSLNKLTPEQRDRIGLTALDDSAKLVGAVDNERAVGPDEVDRFVAEHRARKQRRSQPGFGSTLT